jgi:putative peptidoglycan lipid II flippase
MNPTKETDNSSITKPAAKVMWGGIMGLFVSLASNIIIAAVFGAGAEMDAYLTAMVIPTYFNLVFISSLSFVLVPAFIEAQTGEDKDDAWSLVGTFFWLTLTVLTIISIIGAVLSKQIISVTAPGFQGEKAELASRMLSVLMFSTLFSGLGNLTLGIQNARNRFFLPSVAPAIGTLGNVIVLLTLSPLTGSMALVWGYLIFTIIQAGITVIPVLSHGWNKLLPITDDRVGQMLKLMLPLVLLGMLNGFSPVVERYFASGLPDGQLAYMGYVNKLSNIFVILLASGIATSIFPSMAKSYTREGLEGLAEKLDYGLRLSVAVALPAVLIASAVAIPLISILFEYGAFTRTDTIGVSLILLPFFLRDILFRMVGNIFQRGYYVLKDTTTQSAITAITVILYIAFARFFVMEWGYIGLVWAATIRRGIAILVIWFLLLGKFSKYQLWKPLPYILIYLFGAALAYVGGYYVVSALYNFPVILQLVAGGSIGLLLYVSILYFFDNEILKSIVDLIGFRFFLAKVQTKSMHRFQKR